MKTHLKVTYFAALIFLISFLLAGCPAPTGSTVSHTLSGKWMDAVTGQPISGATVTFSTYTTTTASDGSFSIDLGQQTGTLTAAFGFQASGYGFVYLDPVSVNAGSNTQLTLPIGPVSSSAYPTHAVNVTIKKQDGTEIGNTSVALFIYNANGGISKSGTVSYVTGVGGYPFASPTFGSDCLLVAFDNSDGFAVMQRQVDLSTPSPAVTLTQDPTSTTTVSVTGDTAGNTGGIVLVTPYGPALIGGYTLASPPNTSVNVANPYGYLGYWVQTQTLANWLGSNSNKQLISASNPSTISTNVTLPPISVSLGPTAAPDTTTLANSLAYSPVNGTLSMNSVSGSSLYIFMIGDSVNPGLIVTNSASVVLPSWVQGLLTGKAHSVSAGAADSDLGLGLSGIYNLLVDSLAYGVPSPNVHFAQVGPNIGGFYTKSLTF